MSDHSINILLIKDDPDDLSLVESILKAAINPTFKMLHVPDCKSALTQLSEGNFDLVLSDLSPTDGFDLDNFAQISTTTPPLPIVILTENEDADLSFRSGRQRATVHLPKSQMGDHLIRTLHFSLERHHLQTELKKTRDQPLETERIRGLAETASTTAQEINNPLATIFNMTDTLIRDGELDEKVIDDLRKIHESAKQIGHVVGKMTEARRYARKPHIGGTTIIAFDADAKEDRQVLEEQRALLETILRQAAEGIIVCDVEGHFILVNGAARRLARLDPEGLNLNISAAAWGERFDTAGQSIPSEEWAIVKATHGETVLGQEIRLKHPDGTFNDILISAVPVRNADNKVIGSVAIMVEITARKHAEEQVVRYQDQLRRLSTEMGFVENRERRRLAEDLHDRIGQTLALAKIKLGAAQAGSAANQPDSLNEIRTMLDQMIRDVRALTFEISPPVLDQLGLEKAVEWLAEQLQAQHGLHIDLVAEGDSLDLDQDTRHLLFRAVREILLNVVKHAQARQAKIVINRTEEAVHISIADDGIGFDTSQLYSTENKRSGFGLFSIRERLHLTGGSLEIDSALGSGTQVAIWLLHKNGSISNKESA